MSERMKSDEIKKLITTLDLDKENFTILSSSALTLRGIMQDAGDLDLAVTKEGFEKLKAKFDLKDKGNGFYIVNDKVECLIDPMENKRELIGDYYLQDIFNYLEYLESSSRQKDIDRIPMIKKYIEDNYKNKQYIRGAK